MEPIASYEQRSLQESYRLELFDNTIRAVGTRGSVHFDASYALTSFDVRLERIWTFSVLFYAGLFVVLLTVAGFLGFVMCVMFTEYSGSLAKPYALFGTLGSAGIAFTLLNSRKIQYVRLRNRHGTPALAMRSGGNNSEEFERFVALLIAQINESQRSLEPEL